MAGQFRRLILKPVTATPDRLTQLCHALDEAVLTQNRLAAISPYILRLAGPVQQDDQAFFIEHEPATGWRPAELFDPESPPASAELLLQATTALADALAAAHGSAGRPVVHGGLCPGVLLTGEDGLPRVSDFGFAPAICRVLGVDDYLQVAVGPHPDATAAWEVLDPNTIDRDDRLCAFIDPDKYGQDTLTSFEPGSDIIGAGFILRLLAEHKHPYLHYEPGAHRVLDMAQMMSFGVPIRLMRKDLCESADPGLRAACEAVAAMLARVPAERPSAAELVARLRAAGPQRADVGTLKVQRWVAQLEAMLEAKAWAELDAALRARPAVTEWPQELLSRAANVERRVAEYVSETGRRAAAEAELQAAQKWFERLQAAVNAEQWDVAQEVADARPQVEHWPEHVPREAEALIARLNQARAAQKAAAWAKALQKAHQAKDWTAVGRRFAQRPPLDDCPSDLQPVIAAIEAAYRQHLEDEERARRRIASEHSEVRGWLERAQHLASTDQWVAAIDVLAEPPRVEHWPEGAEAEAEQLRSACRVHLGEAVTANLDQITENIRRQGETLARAVVTGQFAGLLPPERLATAVEYVMWGPPETDADGRAPLTFRLAPPAGPAEDEGAIAATLDFRLRGEDIEVCAGVDELRAQFSAGLTQQLSRIQGAQLAAFKQSLRQSVFKDAELKTTLDGLPRELTGEVHWLGPDVDEGRVGVTLRWDAAALRWAPVDTRGLAARAWALTRAATARAARQELLAGSELLRAYEPALTLELAEPPVTDVLPASAAFEARIAVTTGPRGAAQLLGSGTARCTQLGAATLEVNLAALNAKLAALVTGAQNESGKALAAEIEGIIRKAGSRVKLSAPKRLRTPMDEIAFELRPRTVPPLSLTAKWERASWAYVLPADWQSRVAEVLQAEAATKQVARAKPTISQRGLVLGSAAAVVMLVVGLALYFGLSGRRPDQPPGPSGPSAEIQPPKPTGPSAEVQPPEPTGPSAAAQPPEPTGPSVEAEPSGPTGPSAAAQPPEPTGPSVEAEPSGPTGPSAEVQPPDPVAVFKTEWRERVGLNDIGEARLDALVAELVTPESRTDLDNFLITAAQPRATVSDIRSNGEDAVTLTLTVRLKGGVGDHSADLGMRQSDTGWVPAEGNAAALAGLAAAAREGLRASVQAARTKLEAELTAGRLAAAHEAAAGVAELLPLLQGDAGVAEFEGLVGTLPPSWQQMQTELGRAGYVAAGEPEAATGYPTRLRDAQQRELALVSVPPNDALWQQLAPLVATGGPLQPVAASRVSDRRWQIYYVDTAESPVTNYDAAVSAATERSRALPTRDEWFLAALRLRAEGAALGLFGGLWEWCVDAGGGQPWLCGGSRVLLERSATSLALPKPDDDLAAWWRWLTHPLVMQRRAAQFGDELTGMRSVLRIAPRT